MYTVLAYSTEKTSAQIANIYASIFPDLQARNVPILGAPRLNSLGNQFIAVGDSLTYGEGASNHTTTSYPAQTIPLLNDAFTLNNLGVESVTNGDVLSNCLNFYEPAISSMAAKSVVVDWIGTNSTTDTADWMGGANCLKRTGAKLILVSLKSYTGADSAMQTASAFYRKNWSSLADGFVDLQDVPLLGASGASTDSTYFADGVHLTDAGYALVAQYVANAVNKLFGSSDASYNTATASTYQMVAADGFLFADNTNNAIALTLPDCLGYAGVFKVKAGSNGANAITIQNAVAAETVDGVNLIGSPKALAANSTTRFLVVPGPLTTGGCTWRID